MASSDGGADIFCSRVVEEGEAWDAEVSELRAVVVKHRQVKKGSKEK